MRLILRFFIVLIIIVVLGIGCSQSTNNNNQDNSFNADSLEIPSSDNVLIRQYSEFKLQYNEEHELSSWVAYVLTSNKLEKNFDRTDNFRPDPLISTGTANDNDYSGSGFDRGHLLPAGDCVWSETAMSESFYYSNIAPQEPGLNRGEWSQLEQDFRDLAIMYDSVWICTGPVLFDEENDGLPFEKIGNNEVSVPRRYYKAGLIKVSGEYKSIAFILPNSSIDNEIPMSDFQVSIDELEIELGYDLFPRLPDEIEEKIETEIFNIY